MQSSDNAQPTQSTSHAHSAVMLGAQREGAHDRRAHGGRDRGREGSGSDIGGLAPRPLCPLTVARLTRRRTHLRVLHQRARYSDRRVSDPWLCFAVLRSAVVVVFPRHFGPRPRERLPRHWQQVFHLPFLSRHAHQEAAGRDGDWRRRTDRLCHPLPDRAGTHARSRPAHRAQTPRSVSHSTHQRMRRVHTERTIQMEHDAAEMHEQSKRCSESSIVILCRAFLC